VRAAVSIALSLALTAGCSEDLDILRSVGTDAGRPDSGPRETPTEPMILYQFDEGAGARVFDSSASGPLVHLSIADASAVRWLGDALVVETPTALTSDDAPSAFIEACRESGELTIEAWIVPAETVVDGTRRIVTLSASPSSRNFTLGQGGLFAEPPSDTYVLRLRTTDTDGNGLPMLSTGPSFARAALTHLVAVHRDDGTEIIYVDGAVAVEGMRLGDFAGWAPDHRLVVGNELAAGDPSRAWLGELHFVALYAAALTPEEVRERYGLGALH